MTLKKLIIFTIPTSIHFMWAKKQWKRLFIKYIICVRNQECINLIKKHTLNTGHELAYINNITLLKYTYIQAINIKRIWKGFTHSKHKYINQWTNTEKYETRFHIQNTQHSRNRILYTTKPFKCSTNDRLQYQIYILPL